MKVNFYNHTTKEVEERPIAKIVGNIIINKKFITYKEHKYFFSLYVISDVDNHIYSNSLMDIIEDNKGIKVIGSEFSKKDTKKVFEYILENATIINTKEFEKKQFKFLGSKKDSVVLQQLIMRVSDDTSVQLFIPDFCETDKNKIKQSLFKLIDETYVFFNSANGSEQLIG